MMVNKHEQMNIYIYINDKYMYILYVSIYVTMTVCMYICYYMFFSMYTYVYIPLALHVKGTCPAPARLEDFQLFFGAHEVNVGGTTNPQQSNVRPPKLCESCLISTMGL